VPQEERAPVQAEGDRGAQATTGALLPVATIAP
jgi:hypothetical protein